MRIAHLSDLHFGRHDPAVASGLAADVAGQSPDLIVVSGDFTQVGTKTEFIAARQFLDTLTAPLFAVPGNHDVPALNLIKRFLDPYGYYRRYIADELEPFLHVDGVAIAGLKTSRRMRLERNWSNGSISRDQLLDLKHRFRAIPIDAVRIVVAHHPLLQPLAVAEAAMRPVKRANLALETFAQLGVRLVLSGHFHLSYVRRHEHAGEIKTGEPTGPREAADAHILVAQASSTISTRLRGEPNAYNVIDIEADTIDIRVREWVGERWATRERTQAPT
jgi:3',5'-cyclic AMP phosphodiesterase CpdA